MNQPSPQQQDVIDWVRDGHGSAFVEAVAGAGKTTTLIKALAETNGSVAFAAYNTKIAKEIQAKAAPLNLGNRVRIATFHSFGLTAWRKVYPGVKIDELAKRDLTVAKFRSINSNPKLDTFALKLASLAKQRALGLFGSVDDMSKWHEIVEHFDLADELELDDPSFNDKAEVTVDNGIKLAIRTLNYHRATGPQIVDFDDMIWLPVTSNIRMWQNDWVFVDECQPAGTMVSVPDGRAEWGGYHTKQIPIERLKAGDLVVSFNRDTGAHVMSGKPIKSVKSRVYDGLMYNVSCAGNVTRYTGNHWCWADCSALADDYFVYLMCRGHRFRVGQCKGRWSPGSRVARSGLGFRMAEERADALWLLDCYANKAEALVAETLVSVRFGLPMTRFVPNKKFSLEYTEGVWRRIGNNTDQAINCLKEFNRDIRYPFMTQGQQQERDLTRPRLIRASNLMNGMRMLPFNKKSKHARDDAKSIQVQATPFKGKVFSLEVADTEMYVADDITTHNCQDSNPARRAMSRKMLRPNGRAIFVGDRHQAIYGFCGADSDAIDVIQREFSCEVLPLTVTFRCPKAVVAEARHLVGHIEAHETAPQGAVSSVEYRDFLVPANLKSLTAADAILCRKTKPLVTLAFHLIRNGVACHVEGRDIGAGLVKLISRFKTNDLHVLRDRLVDYADKECAKLQAKGKETQAENLSDRVETLLVMIDANPAETVQQLTARIRNMFTDEGDNARPTLTLSTVHKSKGREWPRVFILGRSEYMPSPWARQDWQKVQEANLVYVAVTRSQGELVNIHGVEA